MKWNKKSLIFKPSGKFEWSKEFCQLPTPIELNDRLRIFYTTRPHSIKGNFVSHTSYIDVDKSKPNKILYIHKKPILTLGGNGNFDVFGIMPGSLIRFDNKLYLFYTGWNREISVPYTTSIGMAESCDEGETFEKKFMGPIIGKNKYDPYLVNGPFVFNNNGLFYLYYSSAYKWVNNNGKIDPIYKIKYATSRDLFNWNIQDEFCIPEIINDEAQNRPCVFNYNEKYHMFFSYRNGLDFRNKKNGYKLGYAYSYDLVNWTRDDKNLGIELSDEGWDSEMMAYPYVLKVGNQIYMFYNGNQFGKYGFGYAELENLM